jgi:hypothetical protein
MLVSCTGNAECCFNPAQHPIRPTVAPRNSLQPLPTATPPGQNRWPLSSTCRQQPERHRSRFGSHSRTTPTTVQYLDCMDHSQQRASLAATRITRSSAHHSQQRASLAAACITRSSVHHSQQRASLAAACITSSIVHHSQQRAPTLPLMQLPSDAPRMPGMQANGAPRAPRVSCNLEATHRAGTQASDVAAPAK